MDPATTALLAEAGKLGFVVLLLVVIVIALVKWVKNLETKRDEREAKAEVERQQERTDRLAREAADRERCRSEVGVCVARINFLEDRAHKDSMAVIERCLDTLNTNARAFERLVELEEKRTGSGQYPTQQR